MNRIEIRIHDEISDVAEKYYGFTFRQWVTFILTAVICVPSYLLLTPIIGTDLAGWIVIGEAVPIVGIGLIPVQGMKAEKVLPFWFRYYFHFNKPLIYKTEKERQAEIESKKTRKKKKRLKNKTPKITPEDSFPQSNALKPSRKELKQQHKLDKQLRLQEKKQRQYQKELAKAKKHFGIMDDIKQDLDREKKLYNSELENIDVQAIIRLGKQLEKLEDSYETKNK